MNVVHGNINDSDGEMAKMIVMFAVKVRVRVYDRD